MLGSRSISTLSRSRLTPDDKYFPTASTPTIFSGIEHKMKEKLERNEKCETRLYMTGSCAAGENPTVGKPSCPSVPGRRAIVATAVVLGRLPI